MAINNQPVDRTTAWADALALMQLIDAARSEKWVIAGSIRRMEPVVSDVDHVLIPRFGDVAGEDMFATPQRVNLLWHRLDELIADPQSGLTKAVRSDGKTCYGERQRAVQFRGLKHEFYIAEPDTWGVQLTVRTGPADLGRHLVTVIKDRGYECRNGFQVYPIGRNAPIAVPDEEAFFRLCGVRYVSPPDRRALIEAIQRAAQAHRACVLR